MKKESNRLKAKKVTFYMRWDFWERQAKKAFFWPVITMAEVDKYCLKNIVTFLPFNTIKNVIQCISNFYSRDKFLRLQTKDYYCWRILSYFEYLKGKKDLILYGQNYESLSIVVSNRHALPKTETPSKQKTIMITLYVVQP